MARWRKTKYGLRRRIFFLRIPRFFIVILCLAVLIFLLFTIVEKNLKPTIVQIAEARASLVATETIHRILYEEVLANVNYNELIYVHKDSEQRITMMQANTVKISRIVSQANLEIQEALKNLKDETIQIPLGQTLGSQLLANRGPRISVKLSPVGTVNVNFIDEFQQAGINQVRHILYLNIETTIQIVVPLVTKGVVVNNQVPIAETIIVGQVPSTYFGIETGLLKGLTQ